MRVNVSVHQAAEIGPRCTECGKVFPCEAFRAQARTAMAEIEAREKAAQVRTHRLAQAADSEGAPQPGARSSVG